MLTPRISLIAGLSLVLTACGQQEPEVRFAADAIVVGAGLSGLSAAVEMGRGGVDVLVVEMNSMAGGHAVMAGGVAIVGTPPTQLTAPRRSRRLAPRCRRR